MKARANGKHTAILGRTRSKKLGLVPQLSSRTLATQLSARTLPRQGSTRLERTTAKASAARKLDGPRMFPVGVAKAASMLLGPVERARRRLSLAGGDGAKDKAAAAKPVSSVDPEKLAKVFQSWSVLEVLEILMDQYILPNAEQLDIGAYAFGDGVHRCVCFRLTSACVQ